MVDEIQKKRGKCDDARIDSFDEDSPAATEFWKVLGGKPDSIPDNMAAEEKKEEAELTVWQVADSCDAGKETAINKVDAKITDGKLDKSILSENDVMVIDTG